MLCGGDHEVPTVVCGKQAELVDGQWNRLYCSHHGRTWWRECLCSEISYPYRVFGLLCSCDESPIFLLGDVTPHGIMEYTMGCHHIRGRQGYLSKSAYGTICAAVFHLFRVHNHVGFSEIFWKELGNLFHGFF